MTEDKLPKMFLRLAGYWGPVVLWMGLLFYLSSRPTLPGFTDPIWDLLLKKSGHAVAYAVLSCLSLRALWQGREMTSLQYVGAWGIAVLYAITDEIHQGFVPGRHPALMDWIIDAIGAVLGLLLAARWVPEFRPAVPADQ